MKKKTSSDDIKVALTQMFGGKEKDWKRQSINTNDAGETVRAFENAVLDRRLTVVEDKGGSLRVETSAEESRRLVEKALLAFEKPAANDAATPEDKIMDAIMSGRDPSGALLAKADPAKLADRFSFTVINDPDMGGVMAIVTPKGCDDEESKKSYSVMQHLFPDAEYIDDCVLGLWSLPGADTEDKLTQKLKSAGMTWGDEPAAANPAMTFTLHYDSEFGVIANFRPYDDDESLPSRLPKGADYDECVVGGWTFPSLVQSPAKIAQELAGRGFTWDSTLQQETDAKLTAEISAALNSSKPSKGPQP
ncbi:MAG: hypothetical protein ACAH83_05590 [Alphaproteobacteria bacterium]